MKIRITESNAKEIELELAKVNGKSSAHAYVNYSEIESVMVRAVKKLTSSLLPATMHAGAKFQSESGSSMPNSYKGIRNSTVVLIERTSSGWFLTNVRASSLYPNQCGGEVLTLTTEQKNEAVKRFLSNFRYPSE